MGLAVVTTASGGLPVVDCTAVAPLKGVPVTEAANGRGIAVTKVAARGLPVVYETIGVATSPASFDGAPVSTTLSNNNLTATHVGTTQNSGALSTAYKSTGKFYFEVTVGATHGSGDGVGVLLSTGTITDLGNNIKCTKLRVNGSIFSNSSSTVYGLAAFSAGGVIGVAIDLNSKLGWFRLNGGLWNGDVSAAPATGVNGAIMSAGNFAPAVCFTGIGTAAGDAFTANFGASAFIGTVPSGFTAGWPA